MSHVPDYRPEHVGYARGRAIAVGGVRCSCGWQWRKTGASKAAAEGAHRKHVKAEAAR